VALAPAAQGYEIARIEPAAGHAPGVALTHNAKPALQHQVGAGETIFRISKNYGVSVLDIMAANDLAKPEALQAGTLVNIPPSATAELTTGTGAIRPVANKVGSALRPAAELGVTETTRATMTTPAAITGTDVRPAFDPDKGTDTADSVRPLRDVKPMTDTERMKAELKRGVIDKAAAAQRGLIWPARGAVVKRFGEKGNGVAYTGINIEVPVGTPVLATEDGIVLYAADGLRTYGQMVLLRHSNGMVSAYAHNSHLLVRKGEKVRKGQVVATSGQSGNAGSPQLHFELRRNAVALDPLRVLPKL
jgi:murein DD-endopeptidase MepM/ murein hydrolase activator NlpD